jgi:flagellar operon protein
MQVNQYNTNVNLLDIARRGHVDQTGAAKKNNSDFKQTFSAELAKANNLNFSKHATQRLYSRGIEMTEARLAQLSDAIDKAAVKGSKETLILDDSAAYVVSIENRTVISAFGRDNLREGVFTSIDSAVII